ncbi:MAG TPA: AbrB/MazE/SpoVT family DNA-binding domain-containing protein [Microbacteriaceae bacterium]
MRVTSKGQVTIPLRIREKYGLMPETQVEFVERDGDVIVKKATHRRGTDRADRLV